MPITPFHFGPGLLFKAYAPAQVSWIVFVLANILIDLEPIGWFLYSGDPAHRQLHSYLGATLVTAVSFWPGRLLAQAWLVWWNRQLSPAQARWLGTGTRITLPAAVIGAALGAYSHIFLDSFMHADMRPYWPWQDGNILLSLISIDALHGLCIATGLWGALWLGLHARINLPATLLGRSLRQLGSLLVGVAIGCVSVVLAGAMIAMALLPLQPSMEAARFDATTWRQTPPKQWRNNPRVEMASDTLRQLQQQRPSRAAILARLGVPDARDTPTLASYYLGFIGLAMDPYTFDIEFAADGSFVAARIVQH